MPAKRPNVKNCPAFLLNNHPTVKKLRALHTLGKKPLPPALEHVFEQHDIVLLLLSIDAIDLSNSIPLKKLEIVVNISHPTPAVLMDTLPTSRSVAAKQLPESHVLTVRGKVSPETPPLIRKNFTSAERMLHPGVYCRPTSIISYIGTLHTEMAFALESIVISSSSQLTWTFSKPTVEKNNLTQAMAHLVKLPRHFKKVRLHMALEATLENGVTITHGEHYELSARETNV